MFRNLRYRVDGNESVRRVRRLFDGLNGRGYRRLFAVVFLVAIVLLYLGPSVLRWLFRDHVTAADPLNRCLDERLAPFLAAERQFNVHIRRYGSDGPTTAVVGGGGAHPPHHQERFIPYVGNGLFGLEVEPDARIMIKTGRYLSLPVNFHPIVSVAAQSTVTQAASVVDYVNGVVHRLQCFEDGFDVSYEYYAHRRMPNVLVQELKINNPRGQLVEVELTPSRISDWPTAITQVIK